MCINISHDTYSLGSCRIGAKKIQFRLVEYEAFCIRVKQIHTTLIEEAHIALEHYVFPYEASILYSYSLGVLYFFHSLHVATSLYSCSMGVGF